MKFLPRDPAAARELLDTTTDQTMDRWLTVLDTIANDELAAMIAFEELGGGIPLDAVKAAAVTDAAAIRAHMHVRSLARVA